MPTPSGLSSTLDEAALDAAVRLIIPRAGMRAMARAAALVPIDVCERWWSPTRDRIRAEYRRLTHPQARG